MADPGIVGGATGATMERWSVGIRVMYHSLLQVALATGLDIGVVFCRRADFEAIGGYDESLRFAEDVKFLLGLRRAGKPRGARLLRRCRTAVAIASARKFDQFGEWHFLWMALKSPWYFLHRRSGDAFADRYWYRSGR